MNARSIVSNIQTPINKLSERDNNS